MKILKTLEFVKGYKMCFKSSDKLWCIWVVKVNNTELCLSCGIVEKISDDEKKGKERYSTWFIDSVCLLSKAILNFKINES